MDEQVLERLREADWFLKELNFLRDSPKYKDHGGIAHVVGPGNEEDLGQVRSCVDGFLFVLVSAKDMLLQEINKSLDPPLPLGEVTERNLIQAVARQCRKSPGSNRIKKTICTLQEIADADYDWYRQLKRYRNAADHRCVLYLAPLYPPLTEAPPESTIYLVKDPNKQGDPKNRDNVRYRGEDLFKFLESVRRQMGTLLARWEADLGLATLPAP